MPQTDNVLNNGIFTPLIQQICSNIDQIIPGDPRLEFDPIGSMYTLLKQSCGKLLHYPGDYPWEEFKALLQIYRGTAKIDLLLGILLRIFMQTTISELLSRTDMPEEEQKQTKLFYTTLQDNGQYNPLTREQIQIYIAQPLGLQMPSSSARQVADQTPVAREQPLTWNRLAVFENIMQIPDKKVVKEGFKLFVDYLQKESYQGYYPCDHISHAVSVEYNFGLEQIATYLEFRKQVTPLLARSLLEPLVPHAFTFINAVETSPGLPIATGTIIPDLPLKLQLLSLEAETVYHRLVFFFAEMARRREVTIVAQSRKNFMQLLQQSQALKKEAAELAAPEVNPEVPAPAQNKAREIVPEVIPVPSTTPVPPPSAPVAVSPFPKTASLKPQNPSWAEVAKTPAKSRLAPPLPKKPAPISVEPVSEVTQPKPSPEKKKKETPKPKYVKVLKKPQALQEKPATVVIDKKPEPAAKIEPLMPKTAPQSLSPAPDLSPTKIEVLPTESLVIEEDNSSAKLALVVPESIEIEALVSTPLSSSPIETKQQKSKAPKQLSPKQFSLDPLCATLLSEQKPKIIEKFSSNPSWQQALVALHTVQLVSDKNIKAFTHHVDFANIILLWQEMNCLDSYRLEYLLFLEKTEVIWQTLSVLHQHLSLHKASLLTVPVVDCVLSFHFLDANRFKSLFDSHREKVLAEMGSNKKPSLVLAWMLCLHVCELMLPRGLAPEAYQYAIFDTIKAHTFYYDFLEGDLYPSLGILMETFVQSNDTSSRHTFMRDKIADLVAGDTADLVWRRILLACLYHKYALCLQGAFYDGPLKHLSPIAQIVAPVLENELTSGRIDLNKNERIMREKTVCLLNRALSPEKHFTLETIFAKEKSPAMDVTLLFKAAIDTTLDEMHSPVSQPGETPTAMPNPYELMVSYALMRVRIFQIPLRLELLYQVTTLLQFRPFDSKKNAFTPLGSLLSLLYRQNLLQDNTSAGEILTLLVTEKDLSQILRDFITQKAKIKSVKDFFDMVGAGKSVNAPSFATCEQWLKEDQLTLSSEQGCDLKALPILREALSLLKKQGSLTQEIVTRLFKPMSATTLSAVKESDKFLPSIVAYMLTPHPFTKPLFVLSSIFLVHSELMEKLSHSLPNICWPVWLHMCKLLDEEIIEGIIQQNYFAPFSLQQSSDCFARLTCIVQLLTPEEHQRLKEWIKSFTDGQGLKDILSRCNNPDFSKRDVRLLISTPNQKPEGTLQQFGLFPGEPFDSCRLGLDPTAREANL